MAHRIDVLKHSLHRLVLIVITSNKVQFSSQYQSCIRNLSSPMKLIFLQSIYEYLPVFWSDRRCPEVATKTRVCRQTAYGCKKN